VAAIEGLKIAFGLEAGWTGDPCLILPYDWLACSTDSPPRVTAVYVSTLTLSSLYSKDAIIILLLIVAIYVVFMNPLRGQL
jgi:hypothetical protein